MDFTIVAGLISVLIAAIPTVGLFFQRQVRKQRRENRTLRAIVQEADLHMFELERLGFTSRGVRPPPRPELLKVVSADDEDGDQGDTPPGGRPADHAARGGARHASS